MKASDVFQKFMMAHGVLRIAVRRTAPVVCVWPDSYKVLGFQIYVMFLVYAVFFETSLAELAIFSVLGSSERNGHPPGVSWTQFVLFSISVCLRPVPKLWSRVPAHIVWPHENIHLFVEMTYIFQRDGSDDVLYATMHYSRVICWHEANFTVMHYSV